MSSSFHDSAYLISPHFDEELDTQQPYHQDKKQLWHIIENQRTIIYELKEALRNVKLERDNLLSKIEELSAVASQASSTTPTPPTPSPTPPPRSPFRNLYPATSQSQHHLLTKAHHHQQQKTSSATQDTNSYLSAEEEDDEEDLRSTTMPIMNLHDSNSLKECILLQLKVLKISLHTTSSAPSPSFTLSIMNSFTGTELWQTEKTFIELIALNSQLKSLHPRFAEERAYQDLIDIDQLMDFCSTTTPITSLSPSNETDASRKSKILIEAYFDQILTKLDQPYPIYSFITTSGKIQKEGYLTMKDNGNLGSKDIFYFILQEKEIKYFTTIHGKLFFRHIDLLHTTQIGRQQQRLADNREGEEEEHAFIILNQNEQPVVLSAQTQRIRDEWVELLYAFITALQKQHQQRFIRKPTATTAFKLHNHPQLLQQTKSMIISSPSSNDLTAANAQINYKYPHLEQPQHHRQRISLDDRAILRYYESNNTSVSSLATTQTTPAITNPVTIHENSSNTSILTVNDSQTATDTNPPSRKNPSHRKSFWSRHGNKLLSLAASPFTSSSGTKINNNNNSHADIAAKQQIFGVSIEEALNVSSITVQTAASNSSTKSTDSGSVGEFRVPSIVYRCIEYLDTFDAAFEEGIYRLSGSASQLSQLKQQFLEQQGDVNLLLAYNTLDVHVVAGLLKLWLRELPINILTPELLDSFIKVTDITDPICQLEQLYSLVSQLPLANYALLYTLIQHLKKIVQHAQRNRMTLHNLSIVFAPTLSIPTSIFKLFMTEFDSIFTPVTTQFILQQEYQTQQIRQLEKLQQLQRQLEQQEQQQQEQSNKKKKRKSLVVSFLPSSSSLLPDNSATTQTSTTTNAATAAAAVTPPNASSADKIKHYYLSKLQ